MQDTGKFRKNDKDQYYTKASVAKKCVDQIIKLYNKDMYQWIEPSAGNGAFFKLPSCSDKIGIDLDPKDPSIQKGDFLTWSPTTEKKRIFFGNPPFGRQSSLAKAFIQHSAKYADVIAYILPRSFVKPSMSRAFPLNFHCVHTEQLEKNAFEVNTVQYDVPCIFQIWEKRAVNRVIDVAVKEEGFEYVKAGQPFHIAFKRAGGLAGKCYPTGEYNSNYHYFLKLDTKYIPHIASIITAVNAHTFPTNTVGPRSLSKGEANEVMNRLLSSFA
jgi:hypothetical protein